MTTNQRLLIMLGSSWGLFVMTGLFIQLFFAVPTLTILIDRSYCPASQWQQLVTNYTDLYQQHQRQQLKITTVILFSDLDQKFLAVPPAPKTISNLQTYGSATSNYQAKLQKNYPKGQLLTCQ